MNYALRFAISEFVALTLLSSIMLHPSSARASPAVTGIACGSGHSLFCKSDGSLWTMGYNGAGQLGIGATPLSTNRPQEVLSSGVLAVAGGDGHSLFLMGSSLWTMGYNPFGELGDGTNTNHTVPEKVFFGTGNNFVTLIGTGSQALHSLFATSAIFLGATGLRGMGYNHDGELGDGTYSNRYSPELIVSSTIFAIACGAKWSLFVRSDGSLWGMGNDDLGGLGAATTNRPVQIISSGVMAVAAGGGHSLFVKTNGSLWAMGLDFYGQLGDNSTIISYTPEQIVASGVTAVAAGNYHSLFIKSDGSLWGMGYNMDGELGLGTTNVHRVPVQIVPSNVVAVAAGSYHSLFIKADGSLWGMGYNLDGELGDGTYSNHLSPIQIVAGPPPAPRITNIKLSGTNLNLGGANGVSGEILRTLVSTNAALPLSQWQPAATNVLNATGNFNITATNVVVPNAVQRFYVLQAL
jgi:alpha-tubulin suppressor-like RCC1 family protein